MKWTLVVLLTAIVAVYGQGGVDSPPIGPKTEPTTPPPVITTTTLATTTEFTTITVPTTTTAAETTTPPPTTQPPTTTSAPPSTTSEPATTTEPATTPATTPAPPGSWVVRDETTNETCIIVSMNMKFKLHDQEDKVVEVPKNATVDGSCTLTTLSEPNQKQNLRLSFNQDGVPYSVNMIFEADEESKDGDKLVIKVKEWTLTYVHKNTSTVDSSVVEPLLRFSGNMTYACDYNRKFKMTLENSLEASDVRIQAFVTEGSHLGDETCEEDKTNDVVPIAVGCALAALVIIVLIAYLIGRRRSRQKGYQSV